MKQLDLHGQKFGKLTVIEYLGTKNGRSLWKALCDCGKEIEVVGHSLKRGNTVSCGCKKRELISELGRRTSHGHARRGQTSHEWRCWYAMKQRCNYPKHKSYDAYGGRGISVCPRWFDNFENFLADMGEAPSIKHQIDRIDNDGDYTPDNCRWALPETQSRNRSSNRSISYQGTTKTLADWCEERDLNYNSVINRLNTLNWDVDRAFNTPTPTGYQKRPNWRHKKKEHLKLSPLQEKI